MPQAVPYWRLSGFYFFYFSTLGGILPFWSPYLKEVGFNALEIGELSAMIIGTKIVSPNIWGWVADHTGKSLRIIRYAAFLSLISFVGYFVEISYFWFAWVSIVFSFFWNASLPQFEAVTLEHLQADNHRYSQIRLWGSVGFIVAVLGIGWWLEQQGMSQLPVVILGLLVFIWLFALLTPEKKLKIVHYQRINLWQILKKPEVIAFFVSYILLQISHGPYYVFFSIYLNELHYSSTLIGFLWALAVIAEVLLFLVMRPLLKYMSLRAILLSSLLLAIVRWVLIARYAHCLELLLIAQLFHAATFAAAHTVAIHLVQQYFGLQHQGKGQALYSSLSFGLGGMIGSLYSGYGWDKWGAQWVYSIAAICCCLALLVAYLWVGREKTLSLG